MKTPIKLRTRSLATEIQDDLGYQYTDETGAIESSLDTSLRDTKSIESQAQSQGVQYVPQIDTRLDAFQNLLNDGTAERYERYEINSTLL